MVTDTGPQRPRSPRRPRRRRPPQRPRPRPHQPLHPPRNLRPPRRHLARRGLPEPWGDELRAVLGVQAWSHRLASGFPFDDVRVSGKTGTLPTLRHEAGGRRIPRRRALRRRRLHPRRVHGGDAAGGRRGGRPRRADRGRRATSGQTPPDPARLNSRGPAADRGWLSAQFPAPLRHRCRPHGQRHGKGRVPGGAALQYGYYASSPRRDSSPSRPRRPHAPRARSTERSTAP